MVKTNGFERFMTSECTKTLILAFISKTGQSVAHTRHKLFLNRFFYQIKDTLRHFTGFKCTRDIIKQREMFAFLH